MAHQSHGQFPQLDQKPQIQPCRYKTGKTLGAGSYSVVKECVHIDTGRYFAAKVINKRMMAGREHMVRNEIAVLKKVSMGHRNILTLVDYFETMNNCETMKAPKSPRRCMLKRCDSILSHRSRTRRRAFRSHLPKRLLLRIRRCRPYSSHTLRCLLLTRPWYCP